MKKEVMKKWVRALRSGKYKQGKNMLKRVNGAGVAHYCCLGVLCEVTGMKSRTSNERPYHVFGRKSVAMLPPTAQIRSGMNSCDGVLEGDTCLANLNDSGKTFAEIANIIEKNWEAL